jgi:hypothetical protein
MSNFENFEQGDKALSSLSFLIPFGESYPVVEDEEKLRVAAQFASLVDLLMDRYAEDVTPNPRKERDLLVLRCQDDKFADVSWSLGVHLYKNKSKESEILDEKSSIHLQQIINSRGRYYFSWRLGYDGIVRRHVRGDVSQSRDGLPDITEFMKIGLGADETAFNNLMAQMEEEEANARLEAEMGLNYQPIHIEEMLGLEQFVKQPGFKKNPLHKLLRSIQTQEDA